MTARNGKKPSKPMSDAIAAAPAILLQEVALLATRSFATTDALIDTVFDLMARAIPNGCQFFARISVPPTDEDTPELIIMRGRDQQGLPLSAGSAAPMSQAFTMTSEAAPALLIIDDVSAHPLYQQWAQAKELDLTSFVGIPLVSSEGRVYGALCTADTTPLSLRDRPDLIAIFQILAQILMHHIEHDELLERVHIQEAAARTYEEQFIATFEQAAVGIAHVSLDGRWLRVNQKLCAMLGYTPEELVALDIITITHPDDRAKKREQMQALIAGTIPSFVMKKRYVRKDSAVVWVQDSVSLLHDAQGDPVSMIVLTENISAHMQAEADHGQTLAQLEAVFATMTDGLFIYDADGRIQMMNQAARDMLGIENEPEHDQRSQAERSQRYQLRDDQGELLPRERRPVTRLLRGERLSGNLAADIRVDTLDGRIIDLSFGGAPMYGSDGQIIGAVGVCRDITDRRQLERKTRDALQSLLELATAVVSLPSVTQDSADDRRDIERVLKLTQSMLGGRYVSIVRITRTTGQLKPIAVVGLAPDEEQQWWAELVDSQAGTHITPDLLDTLLREEPLIVDLAERPSMTGKTYSYRQKVLSIAAPLSATELCILSVEIHNHSGFTEADITLARGAAQLVTLILERERLLHDRTDAQARELALKQTNERMLAFLGIASHELRTPMTSMKASVQLAERAVATSITADVAPEAKRKLDRAVGLLDGTKRQVDKLNRLITELLDVTRIDAGKLNIQLASTDVCTIVADAVRHQRMAWPDRDIIFDEPQIPIIAEIDSDRIEQVLTNFLTNALKYSAPDTSVAVSLIQRADMVHIAVSDHGPGIPPAALPHLWELFHQVEGITQQSRSSVGLGIGLYICKTIAERHGGDVGVESVVGQGSTFWCDVPLVPPITNLAIRSASN